MATGLTERIVARFVPDATNTRDPRTRSAYGFLSSTICIGLNLLLCATKGIVGLMVGSISVTADALNNLSDASSNIVSLIGFKLASRPADKGHPYGHGRFEYLAGMAIAMLVVAVGIQLAWQSIGKIATPSPADFNALTVTMLVLSLVVKFFMASLNHRLARRIDSSVLEATAQDSRNDMIATGAVLAAGIVSWFWHVELDGWAGLAVSVFIIVSGFTILRDTIDPLMGRTPPEDLVRRVHNKILSYPGVLGTHDLMIHDYGPGRQFASAHVEIAADTSLRRSHALIDSIEQGLREQENISFVLHCDPVEAKDDRTDLRNWIEGRLQRIDPDLTVHDVTSVCRDDMTQVSLDCLKPERLALSDDELRSTITTIVRERLPEAECHITIDTGFVSPAG